MRSLIARQNRVLASIPDKHLSVLEPGSALLDLRRGDNLECFHPAQRAFFPITAVISCDARLPDGSSTQIALLNHDHCIGVSRCLMPGGPSGDYSVFIAGIVMSVSQASLVALKIAYPDFLMTLLGLSHGSEYIFANQAVCAATHPVARRVSSWLLYAAALCHRHELDVSQQQIADYLSTRRETVGPHLPNWSRCRSSRVPAAHS